MSAPTVPGDFADIDWTQRAQILNELGTLINNYLTYWSSVTTPTVVPDAGSGSVFLTASSTLAGFVTTLNSVNTEFTLGVTALGVPTDVDYGNFQQVVNSILAYLRALHAAKP